VSFGVIGIRVLSGGFFVDNCRAVGCPVFVGGVNVLRWRRGCGFHVVSGRFGCPSFRVVHSYVLVH